ncbi:hypothetical protein [Bradyrhizobium sp. NP1]|uniref:hypothetical protein n=1 Tax=Bradyrhizobium sp. NP1 TaxID=3049772 RepID=UPI0025A61155|nr:hypothetical protein [Bradyrhizobium sp. NP1]WJR75185.1 hypothetical protein QOU61_20450 [Bradyrhizobium sp. NP1]
MSNAKQHSYEELRDVVVDVLHQRISGNNQYMTLVEHTARAINAREGSNANLGTGFAYQGASAGLHPRDRDTILEIFWDLFRQGVVTLGLDDNNPQWPWFRLSRFGESEDARQPFRFHDTGSYIAMISKAVPDLLPAAKMYLEEAVAAFYSGCFLAATVMLGVAAEAEFLRLIDVANANGTIGKSFDQAKKERFIRAKIEAFRKGLAPHLKTLSTAATEDIDINLNAVQSIIRIARNEAGHPSGARPPSREQIYVNLQLFVPYADQVRRLRKELA